MNESETRAEKIDPALAGVTNKTVNPSLAEARL